MIYSLQKGSYNFKFMKSLRLESAWNRKFCTLLNMVKIAGNNGPICKNLEMIWNLNITGLYIQVTAT